MEYFGFICSHSFYIQAVKVRIQVTSIKSLLDVNLEVKKYNIMHMSIIITCAFSILLDIDFPTGSMLKKIKQQDFIISVRSQRGCYVLVRALSTVIGAM